MNRIEEGRRPVSAGGYTLLELLVVMLIFGLLAGMITPRLASVYESTRFAYQRDEVIAQLARLNYLAFTQGRAFDLRDYPAADADMPVLDLPEGWSIHAAAPIHYFANGACGGGSVEVRYGARVLAVTLSAPLCRARW